MTTHIPLLDMPIHGFGPMSTRLLNCFNNEGLRTIGDVVAHTDSELLRIPNFGRKALRELKTLLEDRGLALHASIPPASIECRLRLIEGRLDALERLSSQDVPNVSHETKE